MNKKPTLAILAALLLIPTAFAGTAENMGENVLQREGVFFAKYEVASKNYLNGQWYENPFTDSESFLTTLGLKADGSPQNAPISDQERYNYSIWGMDCANNEEGAQANGFPNLAACLADPTWGGPYNTLEELYTDWINKGWTEPPPENLTGPINGSIAEIIADPAKIAAFISQINTIPEASLPYLTSDTGWTPEMASALLAHINSLPPYVPQGNILGGPSAPRITTTHDILNQILDPQNPLYASNVDLSKASLQEFVAEGKNFSTTNLTGAQFNEAAPGSHGAPFASVSYNSTNFSGLDMTGFEPPFGQIMSLGFPPVTTYYGSSFANANFTNSKNVTANMFSHSTDLNGTILTGTGITRNALNAAIMATQNVDLATAQAITANITF